MVYPAVLVIAVVVLTSLGWSGTSVGVLAASSPTAAPDPNLIVGTPRPIRSDEWHVIAPLFVAQSRDGYPRYTVDGLGPQDLSVFDVPIWGWTTLFKPWDLPALVLNLEHGFAARWWLMSFFLLFGSYLLLLELTDRTGIAVLFSLGLWLSPFFQWWYASSSLDSVGLGMLALAAFLYSFRAPTATRRVAWLGLAAYSTVAFVLILYPPFQISVALVMIAIGVGELIGRHSELGITWRRIATNLGAVILVVGVVVVAYYVYARVAIAGLNGTVYPGHRRVSGGGTSMLQLLSAPFGLSLAQNGSGISGTNQSEISSFLMLGPFALLQLLRLRMRDLVFRWRVLLLGAAAAFVILTTWFLISLPPSLASLLLLNRVPPYRAIIGVGVAGILLMALLCAAEFRPVQQRTDDVDMVSTVLRARQRRVNSGALVCAAAAFVMYFWAGRRFVAGFPTLELSLVGAGLACAAASVVVLLTSARRAIAGGIAFVLFGAVVALPVNPLYRGLGVLTSSPLLPVFTKVSARASGPGHSRWLSFASTAVTDELRASGLHTLNAVDIYPDQKAWAVLDPHKLSIAVWDRYANLTFAPGPSNTSATLTLPQADQVEITLNPCSSVARELAVGFVVTQTPLTYSCLKLDAKPSYEGGPVYIYAWLARQSG